MIGSQSYQGRVYLVPSSLLRTSKSEQRESNGYLVPTTMAGTTASAPNEQTMIHHKFFVIHSIRRDVPVETDVHKVTC